MTGTGREARTRTGGGGALVNFHKMATRVFGKSKSPASALRSRREADSLSACSLGRQTRNRERVALVDQQQRAVFFGAVRSKRDGRVKIQVLSRAFSLLFGLALVHFQFEFGALWRPEARHDLVAFNILARRMPDMAAPSQCV